MNAQTEQVLLEKPKALSAERRATAEDFIDFLQNRETDQYLKRSIARASEPVFNAVCGNPNDAEYDPL
jgi:hypothetical protein